MVDKTIEDVNVIVEFDSEAGEEDQEVRLNGAASYEVDDEVSRLPYTLDPDNPMACAETLLQKKFMAKPGGQAVWFYRGQFYLWRGSHYKAVSDGQMRSHIWHFLNASKKTVLVKDENGKTERKAAALKPKMALVSNVLDALKAVCQSDDDLDLPCWLTKQNRETMPDATEIYAAANGLLHVPSLKFMKHTPMFFSLTASAVSYDPDAPEPENWLKFMEDIFPYDSEAVEQVEQFGGYCLLPDTQFQKALLMIGKPRSGKGTILHVFRNTTGKSGSTSTTMKKLTTQFGMQTLLGKNLAAIPDLRLSNKVDLDQVAETLLSITGEDDTNTARKYDLDWVGQLKTRFAIATNDVPELKDASGALTARFVIVEHRVSFLGREDHGLRTKLETELPGILNRFLKARQRLYENDGFRIPESAQATVSAMINMASPVMGFIEDRCIVAPDESVKTDSLYLEYCQWCKENGRKPETSVKFGIYLRDAGEIKKDRVRIGKQRENRYLGIGLLLED